MVRISILIFKFDIVAIYNLIIDISFLDQNYDVTNLDTASLFWEPNYNNNKSVSYNFFVS